LKFRLNSIDECPWIKDLLDLASRGYLLRYQLGTCANCLDDRNLFKRVTFLTCFFEPVDTPGEFELSASQRWWQLRMVFGRYGNLVLRWGVALKQSDDGGALLGFKTLTPWPSYEEGRSMLYAQRRQRCRRWYTVPD